MGAKKTHPLSVLQLIDTVFTKGYLKTYAVLHLNYLIKNSHNIIILLS